MFGTITNICINFKGMCGEKIKKQKKGKLTRLTAKNLSMENVSISLLGISPVRM